MNFNELLNAQRTFFFNQNTKPLDFRKVKLRQLKSLIQQNEKLLYEAIYADFGKSEFDTYTTEISFVLKDIEYFLKNIDRLAKPKRVRTNLANLVGNSRIHAEPLGCALIIGAWNYPYQLCLSPFVAAIAAGNTCILKPSEVAPHTMSALAKLINENFEQEYLHVVEGGVSETTELLELRFDKIFFTGSTRVGKIIYQAAAKHLTPVTLELGGKSPVIVSRSADLEVAAKRIVWGKFINGGQTCVAPDYLLVHESVKDELLQLLVKYIRKFDYQPEAAHYTRIINSSHFKRLTELIDPEKVFFGGHSDASQLFIEPTLLDGIDWNDKIMEEEIFGPILPVLSFDGYDENIETLGLREKPLAAYVFSNNEKEKQKFTEKFSFGGGCINDVVMHLSNDRLPFGGVGASGMGRYHGDYGFNTFSHHKSVLSRATWGEPDLKYPPYTEKKLSWIRRLL